MRMMSRFEEKCKMKMKKIKWLILFLYILSSCRHKENDYSGWSNYGGSKDNIHYSSLTQIDTSNVQQLKVAWIYHTKDGDTVNHSQIQCNPLIVDGIVYGTTPQLKLFA